MEREKDVDYIRRKQIQIKLAGVFCLFVFFDSGRKNMQVGPVKGKQTNAERAGGTGEEGLESETRALQHQIHLQHEERAASGWETQVPSSACSRSDTHVREAFAHTPVHLNKIGFGVKMCANYG